MAGTNRSWEPTSPRCCRSVWQETVEPKTAGNASGNSPSAHPVLMWLGRRFPAPSAFIVIQQSSLWHVSWGTTTCTLKLECNLCTCPLKVSVGLGRGSSFILNVICLCFLTHCTINNKFLSLPFFTCRASAVQAAETGGSVLRSVWHDT